MPMSPEEQIAVEEMKAATLKEKASMYQKMRHLATASEADLLAAGYINGLGDALIHILKTTETSIKKIERDFIRKFPD